MPFIHFDEAKEFAIAQAKAWIANQQPQIQVMLIADLFGKLRLILWACCELDKSKIEQDLATQCGAWWSDELLCIERLDPVTRKVYETGWEMARIDADEPRLRVLDRHRSRTAWFITKPVNPPWVAPRAGPPIIVFYSFKGGLGRSTLLASFAIQRAHLGERVCVLDFDLDSPGIGRLLSADAEGKTARWGVVDFLLERSPADAPLSDYYHRCDRVSGSGEIVVFPSGYMDEHYADKLARVDLEEAPEAHESGLWKLLSRVSKELKPHWILLDARTGISEPAGQLLSGIAHLHVLLGTTNDQSWQGLTLVLDRLGTARVLDDRSQAEVLLVQAMVPSGDLGKVAKTQFAGRADEEFDTRYYLADDEADQDCFWTVEDKDSQDAPHAPMPVDYDSKLANFGDIAEVTDALCSGPYPPIVERIVNRFLTEPEA
ncbi:KGGVGR-motif variant AAA ATPase [Ferrovum myxofaciens]|uniref:KGGVGR-motif variant AAA ATPase n=1 Tax=Ferrovum myxofaciens TaxID=416213 RepID=UPI0004E18393|nr:P-loop NTPase [Ferrovum myxofaciens]